MKLKLPKLKGISIKKVPHMLKAFTTTNAPELAAAGAILALGATVFVTVKCYKKYEAELGQKEIEKNEQYLKAQDLKRKDEEYDEDDDPFYDDAMEVGDEKTTEKPEYKSLTKADKAKVMVKCFWPVALTAATSAGLMIASVKFSHKQLKAAMLAATMAETALASKDSVLEKVLGPKQLKEFAKAENEQELEKHTAPEDDDIIERSTLTGETLFYDMMTKRYFKADIERVRNALIECKEEMLDCGGITLNDYLLHLGIDSMDGCDEIGWEMDRTGNLKYTIEYIGSPNGRVTAVIKHSILPQAPIGAGRFGSSKW